MTFARLVAAFLLCLSLNVFAAVDANQASVAELDGVKGIGPALSARIVAERDKAPFKDWHDFVQRVSGVGEKTAERLSQEGLTIQGRKFSAAAYAKAQARAEKDKAKPAAAAPTPAQPSPLPAPVASPAKPTPPGTPSAVPAATPASR